eukprot:jgi/Botrbrau1/8462/Bobra.0237s0079.1
MAAMRMNSVKLMAMGVACATFFATLSSVKYLATLIAQQHAAHLTNKHTYEFSGHAEWHEVIDRAEENIELHLPSWLHKEKGPGGGASLQPGDNLSEGMVQPRAVTDRRIRGPHTEPKIQRPPHKTPSLAAGAKLPIPTPAAPAGQCIELPNTDYWGDAVKWGQENKKFSAQECCESCRTFRPPSDDSPSCNVWVWCGDKERCGTQFRDCWLKHLPHPEAVSPRNGPEVFWTSGLMSAIRIPEVQEGGDSRAFHTVITAQGSAVHWQSRVGYYHFLKVKKRCQQELGSRCAMGGFTRLLHSGVPDELMGEIPTHVVKPLQDKDDKGYIVLNRPWAFVQWVREANIPEKYVLMSEPDHIWLKPMPNLMVDDRPAAFPFFYIEPSKKEFRHITEKFTGPLTLKQAEMIAPIGNAPTMMTFQQLARVAETWMNVSHAIFDDEEAHKEWGWVLEMYGFTIGCYNVGIGKIDLHLKMMCQPPWDKDMDPYYILHYTYGMDYTLDGVFTPGKFGEWRFDKRTYASRPPPRNLSQPPKNMKNDLVRYLINAINEASAAIPGWDEYAETGHASQLWDGTF